jgi:hypothetical protein
MLLIVDFGLAGHTRGTPRIKLSKGRQISDNGTIRRTSSNLDRPSNVTSTLHFSCDTSRLLTIHLEFTGHGQMLIGE